MKVSYSPYTLKAAKYLNAASTLSDRDGVLLMIEWPDGLIGYADLSPWPELGDESYEDQLAGLRKGRLSPQLEQSIWLARRDGLARKQGRNLFDNLPTVKSNYLITDFRQEKEGFLDRIKVEGFESIKIKVGRDLQKEAEFISYIGGKGDFKIRLDFNAVGTPQTYEKFMTSIDKVALQRIQYVEDPFPFDAKAWTEARKFAPLAIDNQVSKINWKTLGAAPFEVVILKPAKMDVDATLKICVERDLKITITSYMDHPVGVLHALSVACELKKTYPQRILDVGCLTTNLFQMDVYSAEVVPTGPFLKRAKGKGIGFDKLLANETWAQVKLR